MAKSTLETCKKEVRMDLRVFLIPYNQEHTKSINLTSVKQKHLNIVKYCTGGNKEQRMGKVRERLSCHENEHFWRYSYCHPGSMHSWLPKQSILNYSRKMIFASLTTSLVLENVKSGEYAETKSSNTSKHLENKPHKRIQYIQCAE